MKLELVVHKDVSSVELVKADNYPLGIILRDGTQDQEGPTIRKVKPNSQAERSHAVAKNDIILCLNEKVTYGAKGKEVQRMLKKLGPRLDLKLQYEIHEACISGSSVHRKHRMSTRLQKESDSFGFVLRKRDSTHPFTMEYPIITSIKQKGPAHRDGLMQEGDRLVKVDNVSLSWLSLADIGGILLEKVNAVFTFEYNVKVIDLSKTSDRKINLEIEVPNVDLGIGLCSYSSKYSGICIGSIQTGSIAERCGVFSVGDIILSVNDDDVEELTVSKANSLLRCATKSRKISFIPNKEKESQSSSLIGRCSCGVQGKCRPTFRNLIEGHTSDFQHLNTPQDTITTSSLNLESRDFSHVEQVKVIKKLQSMVKHTVDLKKTLSRLTREAFESKENIPLDNCTVCTKNHHSVKLCASCLTKINVECAQSNDALKKIISYLIGISLKQKKLYSSNNTTKDIVVGDNITRRENDNMKRSVPKNLIHSLTETLPQVFAGKSELAKSFQALARDLSNVDASCHKCKSEIDSASLTAQKLLLLISLNDPSAEMRGLIDQLVYCLLDTKLKCDADNESSSDPSANEENSATESENISHSTLIPLCDGTSSMHSGTSTPQNTSEANLDTGVSNQVHDFPETRLKVPSLSVNLNKESAFYRLTDIPSFSGANNFPEYECCETVELNQNDKSSEKFGKINAAFSESSSSVSNVSGHSSRSNNKKIKQNQCLLNAPAKMRKTLDNFFFNSKKSSHSSVQSEVRNDSHQASNPSGCQNSGEVASGGSPSNPFQHLPLLSDADKNLRGNKNGSDSNYDVMNFSSKGSTKNDKSKDIPKTHSETLELTLENNGEGFGFGFVLRFRSPNFTDTLPVAIITAIKPKSPAQKAGILAKNDRILAINGKSIIGIPLKDLEKLKRRVFQAARIKLTVEFEVNDVKPKYGTFDVMLNKSLMVGLRFEDLRESRPAVVSGVVKGSAAHRSGQLFLGDKVLYFKCVRNEEFNPLSKAYNRDEVVRITVQRDILEGSKESTIQSRPLPSNPFYYDPGPSNRTGKNFIVRRLSLRPTEGTDSLILEHEVTLYRDPLSWDFGFLVGENPETGRAYITDIRPGGPASATGVMQIYDRIIEVNGVTVGRTEERSVLSLLTQSSDRLDLLIRRFHYPGETSGAPARPQKFQPPPFL